jgi:hypothetical protein
MAAAYLKYNPSTSTHGRYIQSLITSFRQSVPGLADCLANFATMIDGDPSNVANYTVLTTAIGAPDNATAKAIYDELTSLNIKLQSDSQVTNVHAAIVQAIAKLSV